MTEKINPSYDCAVSGHVMDPRWTTERGLPKASQHRACVIPACTYSESRKAPNS